MPRVLWPLHRGRPAIEVVLTALQGRQWVPRTLLADTGAGSLRLAVELILEEKDCLLCGGIPGRPITLGGAYTGTCTIYSIRIQLPALAFDQDVAVVGVPSVPVGFEGLACFRFLNRFTYGNFGDPNQFGVEA
jgi:hypothetical protein